MKIHVNFLYALLASQYNFKTPGRETGIFTLYSYSNGSVFHLNYIIHKVNESII